MKFNIYAIRDRFVGFSRPVVFENDGVALRGFISSVQADTPNACNTYPEDKEFYRLAIYDTDTGIIENSQEMLACAKTYILEKEVQNVQKEELAHKSDKFSSEVKTNDNLPKV